MTSGFDISDLVWGTLNYFKDTLASNSGDPRRDDGRNFLNAGLQRTYGRNTLRDVNGFLGIVVASMDTHQVNTAQKADWLRDQSQQPSEGNTDLRAAYKVYIPELEPSPPPKSADDPVLWFYPNIFPSDEIAIYHGVLAVGTIVKVKYRDQQNLLEPTIVSTEGNIFLSFPATGTGGLPFKFKASQQLPAISSTPRPGAIKSLYIPTQQVVYNAQLEDLGILMDVKWPGSGCSSNCGGMKPPAGVFQIIPQMHTDLVNLKNAYEAAFKDSSEGSDNRFLVGLGYRNYEWQKYLYDGYKSGSPGFNLAAKPGRSRHGWGAAVDLHSSAMFSKNNKSLKFRWLNKYAEDYNFLFNVTGEPWHLGWIQAGTVFEGGLTDALTRYSDHGLDTGPKNLMVASKDNPLGTSTATV